MTLTLLFDILHTQVAVIQYASISFCQNSILYYIQTTYCSPKSFKSDRKKCFSILKTTEKLSKDCKKLAENCQICQKYIFFIKVKTR